MFKVAILQFGCHRGLHFAHTSPPSVEIAATWKESKHESVNVRLVCPKPTSTDSSALTRRRHPACSTFPSSSLDDIVVCILRTMASPAPRLLRRGKSIVCLFGLPQSRGQREFDLDENKASRMFKVASSSDDIVVCTSRTPANILWVRPKLPGADT